MDCPSDAAEHVRTCTKCQARLQAALERTVQGPGGPLTPTFDSGRTLERERPADGALAEGASVGPYVVSKRLGAGAMGAVFAAWDPRLEREVALKVLHLEGDLLDEARLLAKLSHPNVVAVHEVFTWAQRAVLVMERVRGVSLRAWLSSERRSLPAIVDVFTQCAVGLAAAHEVGVIHRDFKPDNVLIDDAGRARLVDFGLAMRSVQSSGGLAGSPAYMALPQLEGAPADERSDQFSWWASLYEAVTGRVPADGPNLAGLFEARRKPLALERVPRRLRKAMARGLSNEPAARFPSLREASEALRDRRPARLIALAAVLVLGSFGFVATRTPDPCAALTVSPADLSKRAMDPTLRAAIERYAAEQEACSALPTAQRTPRAQCLEQVGQELDLALLALDGLALEPSLVPRVLKRVRPAERCTGASLPPAEPWAPAEREATVASLRAHLKFEALRLDGQMNDALAFAQEHLASLSDTSPPVARAWATIHLASALSTTGRGNEALEHFRGLERLEGARLRERTWAALGRWLFQCFARGGSECSLARSQGQRLAAELDEPWAHAFALEIAARETNDVVPVIEAWSRIPGAAFEMQRALGNAAGKASVDDDLAKRRQLLALVRRVERPLPVLVAPLLRLQLREAEREGDLALGSRLLTQIESVMADPYERLAQRVALLMSAGRYRETVLLVDRHRGELPRRQLLLLRLSAEERLGAPELERTQEQLAMLEDSLSELDEAFRVSVAERSAIARGDVAALQAIEVTPGDELLRDWQLAVLRADPAAEADVFRRAEEAKTPLAQRLLLERALQDGRFDEVAVAAARQRDASPSVVLESQLRVLEAWALRQLGRRDDACRVMTHLARVHHLVPRERERAETLVRECPHLGLSDLPESVLSETPPR